MDAFAAEVADTIKAALLPVLERVNALETRTLFGDDTIKAALAPLRQEVAALKAELASRDEQRERQVAELQVDVQACVNLLDWKHRGAA
jgi:hypothetical protein